ncbi:MAG: hypothetical protein QXS96_05195 [Candidatus Caldarchaeum sp.]|uniref:Uncharacterized protein n=1 Tax=Caldiarchaeum subterraneum TaxID=311458 RepID=A0A7J3G3X8_CALS0
MRKAVLAIAVLPLLLLATSAYAVLINLNSADINQLGGTGLVDVNCPANPCQVTKVSWTLTSTPPYQLDSVIVQWTTAKSSGASYTVCVSLYDSASTLLTSGCQPQMASSGSATTIVDVAPNVNPKDVYKVEVVIVEQ